MCVCVCVYAKDGGLSHQYGPPLGSHRTRLAQTTIRSSLVDDTTCSHDDGLG